MASPKPKGKTNHLTIRESVESLLTGLKDSVANDLGKATVEDSWAQFLGLEDPHASSSKAHHADADPTHSAEETHPADQGHEKETMSLSGMLNPNEWLDLSQLTGTKASASHEASPEGKKHVAPSIDYHRDIATTSETSNRRNLNAMEQRYAQIQEELARMVESSNKIIQEEFGTITLEQAPIHVGTYHINFLDWMLITIRTARQKVEDSGAWLSAMKSKKGKKGYWGMFKQHGTSFGMSNERQVATQTG